MSPRGKAGVRPVRPRREGDPGPGTAYKLVIEYEGSRYAGWQRQGEAQGVRTVQGTLERVLQEAGLKVLTLGGSGRTDAGVHALGQVAHLHLGGTSTPRPHELQRIFDEGLPHDVAIRTVAPCPPSFHARHDALSRSYLYQVCRRRSGLAKPFIWWVKAPLDPAKLRAAWEAFEGFHDVRAFADLEAGDDPRCEIQRCECVEHGSLVLLRVTASHFKRSQVRRMVGAAVAAGVGKMRVEDVRRDLESPRPDSALRWSERAAASSGLFLERVRYAGDPEHLPLAPATLVP